MSKSKLESLERSIQSSFRLVTSLAIISVLAYALWFFVIQGVPISKNTSAWGEFGDFIGGLLNPVVAYFAFYWLTRSVILQKEELLETRIALEESALSQSRHAAAAEQSLRIAAMTALLNATVVEIQTLRDQAGALVEQSSKHPAGAARLINGGWSNIDSITTELKGLDHQISLHVNDRSRLQAQLNSLLVNNG